MLKKLSASLIAAVIIVAALFASGIAQSNYKPKNGYVPDEKTAIKIAVAVWEPIYGEKMIATEKPYHATLIDGVWHVAGSLPEGSVGGVAEASIAKDDGRILGVIHGK